MSLLTADEVQAALHAKGEPKTITVRISLPDWNGGHWKTFNNARLAAIDKERQILNNPTATVDQFIPRYIGSLALIKAGFVHIEGIPAVQAAIDADNADLTSMQVITYIVANVAANLEAAMDYPLAWLPSSEPSTSQNGTKSHN